MTTTTAHDAPAHRHLRRRLWITAGWALVALLAVPAAWRGGIGFDLMSTVITVVGLFSDDQIGPVEPDWLGMLLRLAAVAAAASVAVATLRYQRRSRGGCARCGRTGAAPRDLRTLSVRAAWAAAVPALAYAALKLHWGFGGTIGLRDPEVFAGVRPWSPGLGDTAVMALIGVAVAFAMAYRRPRLPRWLLLTPAAIGLLMLLPVGLIGTAAMVGGVIDGSLTDSLGLSLWVRVGIYPTFLSWGALLAVVTFSYWRRTRGVCCRCGQG